MLVFLLIWFIKNSKDDRGNVINKCPKTYIIPLCMMMGLTTSVTRRRRKSFIVPKRQHEEDDEIVSPRRTRSGKVYDQVSSSCTKKSIISAPKPVFGVVVEDYVEEEEDAPSRLNPMIGCSNRKQFLHSQPSPKKRLDYEMEEEEDDCMREDDLLRRMAEGSSSRNSVLIFPPSDEEDNGSASRKLPPKLNYSRKSMPRVRPFDEEEPSSPPTQGVMSLNLFDSPAPSSTPATSLTSLTRRLHSAINRANLNPFTPEALFISHQKRNRLRVNYKSSHGGSFSELQKSLDQISDLSDDNDSSLSEFQPPHAKRIRVSDIHISRYNKEFVELQSLASGEYGCVKVARHRLDGMVYAIKVTKKVIQPCSHEEHVAMNEVFAHAAMMKHKTRGSLQSQINSYRKRNRRFPESELRTVLTQIAKGLHYIHSKDLVHMDIKPENIFIAIEHPSSPSTSPGGSIVADAPARNSGNESTDSGNHSGNDAVNTLRGNLKGTERLTYKIGDLGNIAQIHGDFIPEEGDCRYMAPELFAIHVDRSNSSLEDIPKNSMDDPVMYDRIKRGDLHYLDNYSKEFNQVLRSMVSPDPAARPSPSKLMTIFLNNSNYAVKSRSQLCKELKDSEARIRQLEELLNHRQAAVSNSFSIMDNSISSSISSSSNNQSSCTTTHISLKVTSTPNNMLSKTSSRAVGKGTIKSSSCILLSN
ncbi:WEE1 [Lepeophtheirus salmonis]|uniref:WEE1 n=1 Tax=Lepeophtheirus salmonis TaxID=72036 RepID=A0A7R8HDR2_LEPSM|nr:WEE1 [Lepeophtheirus salmonis]CAF3028216.1 WEE1 [Lepeophtheirus salmonis]